MLQTTALPAAPRAPSLAPAVANAAFNVGIAGGAVVGGAELAGAAVVGGAELAGGGTTALAVTAATLALASVLLLSRRTDGRSTAEA